MAGTHLTRSALLSSSRMYDKHRDGPDALTVGTPIVHLPYTGGTRISLDSTASFERVVFLVRAHAESLDTALVEHVDAKRSAQVPAHMYDWDCRHCEVAVMTEDITDPCPNCLLR